MVPVGERQGRRPDHRARLRGDRRRSRQRDRPASRLGGRILRAPGGKTAHRGEHARPFATSSVKVQSSHRAHGGRVLFRRFAYRRMTVDRRRHVRPRNGPLRAPPIRHTEGLCTAPAAAGAWVSSAKKAGPMFRRFEGPPSTRKNPRASTSPVAARARAGSRSMALRPPPVKACCDRTVPSSELFVALLGHPRYAVVNGPT